MTISLSSPARLLLVASATAFVAFAAGGPATAASQGVEPDPLVVEAFDDLRAHIQWVPDHVLNRGLKSSFVERLLAARRQYEAGRACVAANMLGAHLHEASALRSDIRIGLAEDLYNRGRQLRDRVIADVAPLDPCADPLLARDPVVEILAEDNERLVGRVSFGTARLWTVEDGGETWTQLALPGIENLMGVPGMPSVPSWQALVGVPRGARIVVEEVLPSVRERLLLNLYPFQDQAADQVADDRFAEEPPPPVETFMDPPFTKDHRAYSTDAYFPPNPCAVRLLGEIRDLMIAQVQCNSGQYNPVPGELLLFDSVEFQFRFEHGEGTFITSQSFSPFEAASLDVTGKVLNRQAVLRHVVEVNLSQLACLGEELLILTHPSFRPAANLLRQWKVQKGISASVIDVGPDTDYDTGEKIDALIENRYERCLVRPSYVLIVGDSEFVPPARLDHDTSKACSGCGDLTTGSDWNYATYSEAFLETFPFFAVGRMTVDTLEEAYTVVNKTIQYESAPPFVGTLDGAPFYTTATHASYFQCCRTHSQPGTAARSFIQTSETARNALIANGKSVQRIYTTDTSYTSSFVDDPTPRRYYDGTLLPTDLSEANGFAWDGTGNDVADAFNEGRFLVLHRGHGGPVTWSSPRFGVTELRRLVNGELLPFVYGVNCSSGYWDRETDTGGSTESLMERLLIRPGGGMVAGLGDNRNSPSWANSALARGFFDATWPNVAPEFGFGAPKRRLGDILNHGKIYLLTQVGVAQPAGQIALESVDAQWVMWHAFGDPTVELWTDNPHRIGLPSDFKLALEGRSLWVEYAAEGATITALQDTREGLAPIGRAVVRHGVAQLDFFADVDLDSPIMLSASLENAVSVQLVSDGTDVP